MTMGARQLSGAMDQGAALAGLWARAWDDTLAAAKPWPGFTATGFDIRPTGRSLDAFLMPALALGLAPVLLTRAAFGGASATVAAEAAPEPVAPPAPPAPLTREELLALPSRPPALSEPEGGRADVLTTLKGVGPKNQAALNAIGVFHFAQIAGWTPDEVEWIETWLGFPGRVTREGWVAQSAAQAG
jgi:predicted flap endonuclease-1-like 5' DNA nuclease